MTLLQEFQSWNILNPCRTSLHVNKSSHNINKKRAVACKNSGSFDFYILKFDVLIKIPRFLTQQIAARVPILEK